MSPDCPSRCRSFGRFPHVARVRPQLVSAGGRPELRSGVRLLARLMWFVGFTFNVCLILDEM